MCRCLCVFVFEAVVLKLCANLVPFLNFNLDWLAFLRLVFISELELYKAVMKWIHHDCKGRLGYANQLMQVIRFQDMTPAQVEGLKKVLVCPEVQKAFDISGRLPEP